MDEIDWKKHAKKAIIIICISFLPMLLYVIIGLHKTGEATSEMIIGLLLGTLATLAFFLLFMGLVYAVFKLMYAGQKPLNLSKDYLRDLPNKYPPAIASLVHDLKIDIYRDYTATILNLYCKKIIQIKKEGRLYKFIEIGSDLSNLENHEKYVFDCITHKNKFDENVFKSLIIVDAQKYNLISNEKSKRTHRIILITLCILALLISLYFLLGKSLFFTILPVICMAIFVIIIVVPFVLAQNDIDIVDTLYRRTSLGNHVAREISAFKNFIHDYTLIKDKPISYIELLDEYIPYAIALNEANMIDDFIKSNEEYRNLIYHRF